MPDHAVAPVEVHGMGLIEPLHDPGQGNIPGLDQEVRVTAHENIGMQTAIRAVLIDGHELQELLVVRGVLEYALLLVSADDDMVESPMIDAGSARHETSAKNG